MSQKYLTSDVARLFEVTPDAVIKMEAKGTLPTAERTVSGVRLFNASDVHRVARQRAARRAAKASQEE